MAGETAGIGTEKINGNLPQLCSAKQKKEIAQSQGRAWKCLGGSGVAFGLIAALSAIALAILFFVPIAIPIIALKALLITAIATAISSELLLIPYALKRLADKSKKVGENQLEAPPAKPALPAPKTSQAQTQEGTPQPSPAQPSPSQEGKPPEGVTGESGGTNPSHPETEEMIALREEIAQLKESAAASNTEINALKEALKKAGSEKKGLNDAKAELAKEKADLVAKLRGADQEYQKIKEQLKQFTRKEKEKDNPVEQAERIKKAKEFDEEFKEIVQNALGPVVEEKSSEKKVKDLDEEINSFMQNLGSGTPPSSPATTPPLSQEKQPETKATVAIPEIVAPKAAPASGTPAPKAPASETPAPKAPETPTPPTPKAPETPVAAKTEDKIQK